MEYHRKSRRHPVRLWPNITWGWGLSCCKAMFNIAVRFSLTVAKKSSLWLMYLFSTANAYKLQHDMSLGSKYIENHQLELARLPSPGPRLCRMQHSTPPSSAHAMFNRSNLTNLNGTFTQHNNVSYGSTAGQGASLLPLFNGAQTDV